MHIYRRKGYHCRCQLCWISFRLFARWFGLQHWTRLPHLLCIQSSLWHTYQLRYSSGKIRTLPNTISLYHLTELRLLASSFHLPAVGIVSHFLTRSISWLDLQSHFCSRSTICWELNRCLEHFSGWSAIRQWLSTERIEQYLEKSSWH